MGDPQIQTNKKFAAAENGRWKRSQIDFPIQACKWRELEKISKDNFI